ncbi:MAG: DUF6364 family protein [Candidatus Saccharimonadales bacterium]
MKTKLTLSIDKDLVEFAHKQARTNKSSVSGMFSEYLQQYKIQSDKANHPSIASMVGSLKLYSIDDSKQNVRAIYEDKYSS